VDEAHLKSILESLLFAAGEPVSLVEKLVEQRKQIGHARVFCAQSYTKTLRPEHADALEITSYCAIGTRRDLARAGVLNVIQGWSRDSEIPHQHLTQDHAAVDVGVVHSLNLGTVVGCVVESRKNGCLSEILHAAAVVPAEWCHAYAGDEYVLGHRATSDAGMKFAPTTPTCPRCSPGTDPRLRLPLDNLNRIRLVRGQTCPLLGGRNASRGS